MDAWAVLHYFTFSKSIWEAACQNASWESPQATRLCHILSMSVPKSVWGIKQVGIFIPPKKNIPAKLNSWRYGQLNRYPQNSADFSSRIMPKFLPKKSVQKTCKFFLGHQPETNHGHVVQMLNCWSQKYSEHLILKVVEGKDFFFCCAFPFHFCWCD